MTTSQRPRGEDHAHHDAPAHHDLPGTGELRAYWVTETILAWPPDLLPAAVAAEDDGELAELPVTFGLVAAPDGGARVVEGMLRRDVYSTEIPLTVRGTLEDELGAPAMTAYPALRGYIALSVGANGKRLTREDVEALLMGQLTVVQRATASTGGWITAATGVQTGLVIDHLYGEAAARDGSAPLGVTWQDPGTPQARPAFALWAPTARAVTLLAWPTPDPTGSVPLVDGQAVRVPAVRLPDGRWEVTAERAGAAGVGAGSQYLWEVRVFVPSTGRVEVNVVTDPYSRALTVDSRRSVAVDLDRRDLRPSSWRSTLNPVVVSDAARAIYELHVRDFSAVDQSVPARMRGTYSAFTIDTDGTRHLRALASAGIDTIHLLPTFDFSSVPEERADQKAPAVPSDASPFSRRPQAAVSATADRDAYNWGYDPVHWMAPEGSYARAGHQDGGARVVEFREMVAALHGMGLQVVLDQVFNHTAAAGQEEYSVLDKIVPGYYHRLDATGAIEMSTCCNNVATERLMAERLMIDSCVSWVVDYRVDGFRFDLMGYHSVDTMARLQSALDSVGDEAVGHRILIYGEGWNMGEVADNALFRQAVQGQIGGLGIGTFNDRVRDAVHGGDHFDVNLRIGQGFGTGALTDPNEVEDRTEREIRSDLAWRTELVCLSLAGNLRLMELRGSDGARRLGEEFRYHGDTVAAYGLEPVDSVNYVCAHDDETLFDVLAYKLPLTTSMADRVRMNTLCLAVPALGQSPCFWAAGAELLRSKSLDTDSYNSGDHYNAIDWTGQDNGWGRGLPPAQRNFESWVIQADLLRHDELRPTAKDIATAREAALDLLRLRHSTPLLSLGSAALIRERVSFPCAGPEATPGVVVMVIDDGAGEADIDPALDGVLVVLNATPHAVEQRVEALVGRYFELSEVQVAGSDPVVRGTTFDAGTGTVTVPARTVAVLVER
ncbi:alpha-1,6-glucosidase domain-containing protein [Actinomyces howellii]|uniref:Pullulanase n=1 Tax=Actinomyces howellii TaxID=52771 RepID=A0A3S4RFT4_9ACTO|nr:alpha-1,6-glucosidase domain-containing protein [Actinomyces howellii]VEG28451.1 Pullulanase precursor [Actinomyces howellii]